ncbi:MAG: HIT domain-containing protein [Synergistaceae bacterium]|jgi:ATP adenylyltransferase|nr:HIT domain-containing protein [Synergistaceae bacterium]
MDIIHAPWRMEYINSAGKNDDEECIFCKYPKMRTDDENLIISRGSHVFLMLNRYPYSSGHLMVVPYRHTSDFLTLTEDESLDLMKMSQSAVLVLKKEFKPDGFNLGINLGKVAGAGIDSHIHLHIVPRWNGDTNFMSVTAETKVLPEALAVTWKRLSDSWNSLR